MPDSPAVTEAPSASSWRMLWAGLAMILASSLLTAFVDELAGLSFAMFVPVLLGLGGMFWIFSKGEVSGGLLFTAFLIVATAGLCACVFHDCKRFGASTDSIPVSESPKHAAAAIFHFKDGAVVKDQLAGRHEVRGRSGTVNVAWVVPVVPGNWQPGDPVPLWAAGLAESDTHPKANWQQPVTGGVQAGGVLLDDLKTAAQNAVRQFHLSPAPNAPIIWLSDDPARTWAEDWIKQGWAIGIIALLWIAVVTVRAVIVTFRKTRATEQPRP